MTGGAVGGAVVVGVGNPDCGDDGVGHLVVRLLHGRLPDGTRFVTQSGSATELLALFAESDAVLLIDAAQSGAPPGTIHRIDCNDGTVALPTKSAASSHGLGVAEAIGLARALGSLPRRCILYAVEGAAFAPGARMSVAVTEAAGELAAHIAREWPAKT
jgi:hydrogenase maturation protease